MPEHPENPIDPVPDSDGEGKSSSSPYAGLTGEEVLQAASGREVVMSPEKEAIAKLSMAAWDLLASAGDIPPVILKKMVLSPNGSGAEYAYYYGEFTNPVSDGSYVRELRIGESYMSTLTQQGWKNVLLLTATTPQDNPAEVTYELSRSNTRTRSGYPDDATTGSEDTCEWSMDSSSVKYMHRYQDTVTSRDASLILIDGKRDLLEELRNRMRIHAEKVEEGLSAEERREVIQWWKEQYEMAKKARDEVEELTESED